jgi:hypothetical protein
MDVGQMNFGDRQAGCADRVVDRDRGVRVGARIDDDRVRLVARLLDPVDELAFVVGLAELDRQAQSGAGLPTVGLDVGQRVSPIDGGFALAQHIQVRAVQDIDGSRHFDLMARNDPARAGLWSLSRFAPTMQGSIVAIIARGKSASGNLRCPQ